MILTKSEYLQKIDLLLQDNSTQLISPLDLRISFRDLVDSVHLLTEGAKINSANFATPNTRTTLAGELALDKLKYAGRSSVDNSAFGYYSLGANYGGSQNTSIGSHSLGCNLHGSYNTAVGFNAIAGNTVGSGNTAVGSMALQSLRTGSFNIAIGHGAASHIPTGESYKLYIGVHEIDGNYSCADFSNSGLLPLLYGDTKQLRLAIASQTLHNFGVLQVSGDITPSHSGNFNLGNTYRPWNSINNIVYFSGEHVGIGTNRPSGQAVLTVDGDIVPKEDKIYSLGYVNGNERLLWDGYFNDILVSGNAIINDLQYHTINECLYDCKTLHLATSGVCDDTGLGFHNDLVCGYLNDEALDGAGFETHSSGHDYLRDYKFIFRNADPGLTCLDTDNHFSRSRWQSNISIEVTSGNHFQGNRLLGKESVAIVKQSGCYGLFLNSYHPSGHRVFLSSERQSKSNYPTFKDVNFISNSGTHFVNGNPSGYNYAVMYGSVDSGVKISQEFATRIKTSNGKRGFSFVYHDEFDESIQNCPVITTTTPAPGTTTTTTPPPGGTTTTTTTTQPPLFGNGIVITGFNNDNDYAQKVLVQTDGKIIVAGYSSNNFALARYNTNGSLDSSFGTGGKVTTNIGGNDICESAILQKDGKIILVGSNSTDYALARYNTNGTLDTTFGPPGAGGIVTTDAFGLDYIQSAIIQNDGKIVVGGYVLAGNGTLFSNQLIRYNTNGSVDSSFSYSDSQDWWGTSVNIQNDSKIIFAGFQKIPLPTSGVYVKRFNTFGAADTTFGTNGVFANYDLISHSNSTRPSEEGWTKVSTTIQSDGKILISAISNNNFGLARCNSNGTLDSSFGTNGIVTTDFYGGKDNPRSIAVQSDGKILVAGWAYFNATPHFAIARYNSNGTIDTSFGSSGKVITDVGVNQDYGQSIAIQSDGKILLVGHASNGFNYDFALVRYNTNGSLDTSFGG